MLTVRDETAASEEGSLVKALLRPEAYPHPVRRVRLHETHISWVFLAGRYAYKVKKPVDFGFLDYSTLEQRRQLCEQEVLLNRRLCPEAYLGVVPITQGPQGLRVGGDGPAREYAVQMRRLPASRMLDQLVRAGRAGESTIERVARRVAEFHAEARRGPDVDRYGSLETIRANWQENFDQLEPYVGRTIQRTSLDALAGYVNRFLAQHADLLVGRVEQGRIRDGHGDLRAESVCVTDGLCIFDCIEFNERFRYADVAAEVAFLAMDLDARGRPDLGYWFADRYIAATGDRGMRQLLPFYQCYRACVRGKVQGFRLDQPARSEAERRKAQRRARHYLRLAESYSQAPAEPLLIVVCGLPGTGKTALARALGVRLGGAVYSSDRVRKELLGLPPTSRPAGPLDAGLYAPDVSQRTYRRLLELGRAELAEGVTVVLDATFRHAAERQAACELARQAGARCWIVECVCPEAVVRERLARRIARGEGASDADWSVYLRHRATFEPVSAEQGGRHVLVDTTARLPTALTRALRPILEDQLARPD